MRNEDWIRLGRMLAMKYGIELNPMPPKTAWFDQSFKIPKGSDFVKVILDRIGDTVMLTIDDNGDSVDYASDFLSGFGKAIGMMKIGKKKISHYWVIKFSN